MIHKTAVCVSIAAIVAGFMLFMPERVEPSAEIEPQTSSVAIKIEPEQEIVLKTTLPAELARICACESTGDPNGIPTQYEQDGVTVLRGKINENDTGYCQINTEQRNGHVTKSKQLGYDLWTEEGNKAYAKWLYEHEGTTPWLTSQMCWE